MSISILDLAAGIHFNDLLESSDTSIPKIISWLLAHVGDLNDSIGSSYVVSGNNLSPELGSDEAAIFSYIYLLNYYNRQTQANLGATQYDWSEISEGDSRIRRVSKNEVAKNYRLLATDTRDYLDKLIEAYKRFGCVPASIHSNINAFNLILQQP